jgi:hypothetical protein
MRHRSVRVSGPRITNNHTATALRRHGSHWWTPQSKVDSERRAKARRNEDIRGGSPRSLRLDVAADLRSAFSLGSAPVRPVRHRWSRVTAQPGHLRPGPSGSCAIRDGEEQRGYMFARYVKGETPARTRTPASAHAPVKHRVVNAHELARRSPRALEQSHDMSRQHDFGRS